MLLGIEIGELVLFCIIVVVFLKDIVSKYFYTCMSAFDNRIGYLRKGLYSTDTYCDLIVHMVRVKPYLHMLTRRGRHHTPLHWSY